MSLSGSRAQLGGLLGDSPILGTQREAAHAACPTLSRRVSISKRIALVYYPVYSVWRTGQFVKMEFRGHFQPESPASGGQTTNAIPTEGGMLKFKSVVGNQVVEYAALLDHGGTHIVGALYLTKPGRQRPLLAQSLLIMDIEVKVVSKNMSVHDYLIDHSGLRLGSSPDGLGMAPSPGVHRLADEPIRRPVPDPARWQRPHAGHRSRFAHQAG